MRTTLFLFITLFTVVSAFSQVPVKAETPAVIPAPDKFISAEDGFTVRFPAKPVRTVSQVETAAGKLNVVKYSLGTTIAYYSAVIMDLPVAVTDPVEIRARYEGAKSRLSETPNIRVISDMEVIFGDHPGRQIVYEGNGATYTVRFFLIAQRFFELTVGVRGSAAAATEKVRAYNQKTVDGFFNSFAVLKIPEPKTVATELPEDFGVTIENGLFTSKFFGVRAQIPADWQVTGQEENEVLLELSREAASKKMPDKTNVVDSSVKNSRILLLAQKLATAADPGTGTFSIVAEKISFPNFRPLDVISGYQKMMVAKNEMVSKPPTVETINGVEFAWIEILSRETGFKRRFYIANRGGIGFEIFFVYQKDTELEPLLKVLRTVSFEPEETAK